jgi:hypothetical protein
MSIVNIPKIEVSFQFRTIGYAFAPHDPSAAPPNGTGGIYLLISSLGQLDLADAPNPTVHTTNLALFSFNDLATYFAHDYADWVPQNVEQFPPRGSAAGDVADAMGSTTNPDAMVNLERGLNVGDGSTYVDPR